MTPIDIEEERDQRKRRFEYDAYTNGYEDGKQMGKGTETALVNARLEIERLLRANKEAFSAGCIQAKEDAARLVESPHLAGATLREDTMKRLCANPDKDEICDTAHKDLLHSLRNAIHLESAAIAPQTSLLIELAKEAIEEIDRLRADIGGYVIECSQLRAEVARLDIENERFRRRLDALPTDQDAEIQWLTAEVERIKGIDHMAEILSENEALGKEMTPEEIAEQVIHSCWMVGDAGGGEFDVRALRECLPKAVREAISQSIEDAARVADNYVYEPEKPSVADAIRALIPSSRK